MVVAPGNEPGELVFSPEYGVSAGVISKLPDMRKGTLHAWFYFGDQAPKASVMLYNTKWIGSMYSFTQDERVKYFYDTVEAYMPTKSCKMTIFGTPWGDLHRNYCIDTSYTNYLGFLMGDNGYTVINVPENPQDMTCLVIKDSYGNAFVPYLTEHYGNIVVVDPRYADLNIFDFYDDYKFEDIVFMVNIMSSNNSAWYKYLLNLLS
jgi:hypothetical protein